MGVGALGTGSLAVVGLAGLGWAISVRREGDDWIEVPALAPVFGLAAVILAGVLIDAAGLRLAGIAGGAVAPIAAVAGFVPCAESGISTLRRRRPCLMCAARAIRRVGIPEISIDDSTEAFRPPELFSSAKLVSGEIRNNPVGSSRNASRALRIERPSSEP